MKILRTTSENGDFQNLVQKLDTYLAEIDGDEHAFYHQFNTIDALKNCVVIFSEDQAVSCGAIKVLDENSMEVKRMYTLPEFRGKGFAGKILHELELWAKEMNYQKTVLETGKRQFAAVSLYQKSGYSLTPNYGQYKDIENSVCFSKQL